jgi:hypothetical protein
LADPNETNASRIDITATEWRTAGCAWCHPGGGPMEYDREGYRFDGAPGLHFPGANPAPKVGDYQVFGTLAGADASAFAGAGFFEVSSNTGMYPPEQLINTGTMKAAFDPVTSTHKTVAKKQASVAAGGVAEVDCLLCHYSGRYANLERNFALPGATSPKLAASLGLVGQGTGQPGLLTIGAKGAPSINPNITPTTWSWNEHVGDPGTAGNSVILRAAEIVTSPPKENCALCHFPDRSMASAGCADPSKCGPASKPLGFTAFQKHMPVGSTRDGDEIPGVNGRDGNNDVAWNIAKGRSEGGKRGESINDNLNHDAHMKWPAFGAPGMNCTECHFNLEGDFDALTDGSGSVIQPAISVARLDHQFAKGDNAPDGKNMDQLDNTVTCASCHQDWTHPNAGAAPNPASKHAGFPAFHFDRISCKTCHIPILNGPVDQDVADFVAGPYQTFERAQILEAPTTGVNRRPLLIWRPTEHGAGHLEIQPVGVMACVRLSSATAQSGEQATTVVPTYQRLGKKAAEQLRGVYGDQNGDGLYDWRLNDLQDGDRALIVNERQEIVDYMAQVATIAGAPANPVIDFSFNTFSISHNVRPLSEPTYQVLGSRAGGGCLMCHSSSDPGHPNYSASSVGFFDRTFTLFNQPIDGGNGMVQTTLPASPPLSGNLERLVVRFQHLRSDGTSASVDLSAADGQRIGNSLNQGEALGYDVTRREFLMSPKKSKYDVSVTAGPNGSTSPAGTVAVRAGASQTVAIDPDPGYSTVDVVVDGSSVGAVGQYVFDNVVEDHTLTASFVANPSFSITATAGPNGTVSPAGVTTVLGGTDATFTIQPDAGYRLASLTVDGYPSNPYETFIFRSVDANHSIAATFVGDTFTVTASLRGRGSITPAGATTVARGGSVTYTIAPDSGYKVDRVIVDGTNVGAVTSFTLDDVHYDRSIKAYFVRGSAAATTRSKSLQVLLP